ncbi:MAG: DUF1801 domain-containing protein [Ginsengibacter sp.]
MENDLKFEEAIQSFTKEIQEIARQARNLIHEIYPEVVEVVWVRQKNIGFGTGIKKKTEHFCWLMPANNHVNLGFNFGAELPDPKNLLEGTGKLFRHIKIKSSEQLIDKDLIRILKFSTTYRVPKFTKKFSK